MIKNKIRFKNGVGFLMSIVAFTGCDISDNAQKSADNSKRAADNSSELLDLNATAFGDVRQGGARDRRERSLEKMMTAVTLNAKLASAAAYMSAFEFQLYKGNGFREDNAKKRELLFTEAVAELMRTQKDFSDTDLNRMAIAGTLHKVSERQREASIRYGYTSKSILDLFAEALSIRVNAESDPAFLAKQPTYLVEALRSSDDVIRLLQIRANLFTVLGGVDVMKSSAVQIDSGIEKLKAAVQTKRILMAGGIEFQKTPEADAIMTKLNETVLPEDTNPFTKKLQEVKALIGLMLK